MYLLIDLQKFIYCSTQMALGIFPGTNRKQKKMQGNRRKVNINISNTGFSYYYFHVSVKCTLPQNSKKERTPAFQKSKPFCCICTLIQPCQNIIWYAMLLWIPVLLLPLDVRSVPVSSLGCILVFFINLSLILIYFPNSCRGAQF